MLSQREVNQLNDNIASLDIDAYVEQVIAPAEAQGRKSAPEIVRQLGRLLEEKSSGPYYQAVLEMDFGGGQSRQIGFIAQDRSTELGSWMPQHHLMAVEFAEHCSAACDAHRHLYGYPGADAGEDANANNQAHSISRLITAMSNVHVPNVGIIFGVGYSVAPFRWQPAT